MNKRYSRTYFKSNPNHQFHTTRGNRGHSKQQPPPQQQPYFANNLGSSIPMSPRSVIRYNNQYPTEDEEDHSSYAYSVSSTKRNNSYQQGDSRLFSYQRDSSSDSQNGYRKKRAHSYSDEELGVKLPAPCKLSKVDVKTEAPSHVNCSSINNSNSNKTSEVLESPASPIEASSLLSPESPPPSNSIIIPQSTVIHQCRLCSTCAPFRTEYDLLVHLTVIHYRSKLLKRVTRPYKCLKCGYTPAVPDDPEDLLMHYGCEEKLSLQFYEQELKDLSIEDINMPESHDSLSGGRISINCDICKSAFDTERLFVRHISLRHFTKILCHDLPKRWPFICPLTDCQKQKNNLHALMLHYGCEHNISMELYLKETELSKDSIRLVVDEPPLSPTKSLPLEATPPIIKDEGPNKSPSLPSLHCQKCPKKTFASPMSLNYHLMVTHFFPDLPKVGPYACTKCSGNYPERIDFTRHFLEEHLHELLDNNNLPKKTESKSSSDQPSIHQSNNSSNGHHQHRQSDVRRKITQKWETTSVEVTNHRIEELEKLLMDATKEHDEALRKKSSDFEKWVLQKEKQIEAEIEKRKSVEKSLESSKEDAVQLQNQLEEVRKSHKSSEELLVEKHSQNLTLSTDKKTLTTELEKLKDELKESRDLQANLEMSLKDLKVQFDSRGDSLVEKDDVFNALKEEHSKAASSHEKALSKANKSLETLRSKLKQSMVAKKALGAQIKEQSKQAKKDELSLKDENEAVKKSNEKLEKDLQDLTNDMEELKKSGVSKAESGKLQVKIDDLKSQLEDSEDTAEGLKVQNNSLSDRLAKVLKVLQDYETVLQEKNDKLAENKVRITDLESRMASSSAAASDVEKSNAEYIQTLETNLNNAKKKLSSCSNVISNLAKDKTKLESSLKDSIATNSSLQIEIEFLQQQASGGSNPSCNSSSSSNNMNNDLINDQIHSLESTVHNKDLEIEHLKVNLNQLKLEMRKEKASLESQLKEAKAQLLKKKEMPSLKRCKAAVSKKNDEASVTAKPPPKLPATKESSSKSLVANSSSSFDSRLVKFEPLEADGVLESVPLFNASKPSIVLNIDQVGDRLPSPTPSLGELSIYDSDKEELTEEPGGLDTFVFPSMDAHPGPQLKVTSRRDKVVDILEDLTGKIDESEDDVVCAICLQYDPPLPEDAPRSETYNTEWVGCDCGSWYHKICTKLSKFSTRFSCKSVKKKCLKQP